MTHECPEVPDLIHINPDAHGDHSTCRHKTRDAIEAELSLDIPGPTKRDRRNDPT